MALNMDSSSRVVLTNRTNIEAGEDSLEPSHSGDKKPIEGVSLVPKKRSRRDSGLVVASCALESSDDEEHDDALSCPRRVWGRRDVYNLKQRSMANVSGRPVRYDYSTRRILRSFVSSSKVDVYNLHSIEADSFSNPPYACSYSHSAKRGGTPLLAVATEQGVVYLLNTVCRRDWDVEPQRVTFQPYPNGIFDVQWSPDDTLLATASGGKCAQVSQLEPTGVRVLRHLIGHSGTVKCISWDPTRAGNVLSTGGRDGSICVWDLRVEGDSDGCAPVIKISGAHEEEGVFKPRARKGKVTPAAPMRSVTSLHYSNASPNKLVSSGSVDGVIREWDLLMPEMIKRGGTRMPRPKGIPARQTLLDPTTYQGTRRARGISSLLVGTGPTSGFLFALGNDSLVHTYDRASLEPLSGRNTDPAKDSWSYGHPNMHTNSFNVRAALSPCGRWLASGGVGKGSVFLFDVSGGAASHWSSQHSDISGRQGVQLCGQSGEVGVMDWADGMLASCADDGTVRIWRPDVERHRECQEDPERMSWNWKWASGDDI